MMKRRLLLAIGGLAGALAWPARMVRAEAPPPARLTDVPIQSVMIDDPFWSPKLAVWRRVTIADCLDKFDRDGAMANFDHVARGELTATHGGPPWYDGLIYEMIRAAGDFLAEKADPELETRVDGMIDRISAAAARDLDGYVNTYTQMKEPSHRWGQNGGNDLWQHDLYNAGALVDAGVHYYRATGKTTLLETAVRMANLVCREMGPPPRRNIIPGHAIGEEAMLGLYRLLEEQPDLKARLHVPVEAKKYLELAQFWIDARGHHEGRKDFGAYDQDDVPVIQQPAIEGHAVRAALMCSALTALGMTTGRSDYADASRRLWASMTGRRMYVTGGVGSFAKKERFGPDYVLPNNGYAETCAAVANGFFDQNMNLATGDSAAADELERALYNGALSGVSLAGNSYFYENPLECSRSRLRWPWHACPCCPPMFLKMMSALPGFVYATDSSGGVYVNLYIGSEAKFVVMAPHASGGAPSFPSPGTPGEGEGGGRAASSATDHPLPSPPPEYRGRRKELPHASRSPVVAGDTVTLKQMTRYPWDGDVRLTITPSQPSAFDVCLRIPGWCRGGPSAGGLYTTNPTGAGAFTVSINGQPVTSFDTVRGYARFPRTWQRGDVVDIHMSMPVQRVKADPRVAADRGRVALMRGPIVYCLESIDNGGRVRDLFLPDTAPIRAEDRPELLGGVTVLHATARRVENGSGLDGPADITAIPYYANANRGPVSMLVWIPTDSTAISRGPKTSATRPAE